MTINKRFIAKILLCLVVILLISSINTSAAPGNLPPDVSNEFPAQDSIDIELNPVLTADILDVEGDSVAWTVQLLNLETSWEVIASGTAPSGETTLNVPTTTITQYDFDYSWKVTATDSSGSGQTTEKSYTFKTRKIDVNYPPFIRNPNPANNSIDIPLNPELQAYIKDIDGDPFDWTVALWDGSKWKDLDSGTAPSGETTVNVPTTTITDYDTSYSWKVSATAKSGSKQTRTAVFNFKTKPANHMPDIFNMLPANQATDVPLSPTLYAEITDFENDPISWTVEISDRRDWVLIGSGE